jgi:mRNA (2'-O-methyladenosine-N6-)-methyltransferase
VALGYSQLTDRDIEDLPVPQLQSDGFLFVWVINAKYKFTLDLFERWGYTCVLSLFLCRSPSEKRSHNPSGLCFVWGKGKLACVRHVSEKPPFLLR